jgi:hypothetical protein
MKLDFDTVIPIRSGESQEEVGKVMQAEFGWTPAIKYLEPAGRYDRAEVTKHAYPHCRRSNKLPVVRPN